MHTRSIIGSPSSWHVVAAYCACFSHCVHAWHVPRSVSELPEHVAVGVRCPSGQSEHVAQCVAFCWYELGGHVMHVPAFEPPQPLRIAPAGHGLSEQSWHTAFCVAEHTVSE